MDNLNNISYDKNWKKASDPIRYIPPKDSTAKKDESKPQPTGKPLLTIIQIIICLIIVLTAYIIKTFGGEIYKNIKSLYETEINNEIILNPYENSLDKLINATKD